MSASKLMSRNSTFVSGQEKTTLDHLIEQESARQKSLGQRVQSAFIRPGSRDYMSRQELGEVISQF
jgi:hypothetical protein